MSQSEAERAVTLVAEAVHNPDDARHFMRLKPVTRRITVRRAGTVLAESTRALRVIEMGRDAYDPILYLPPEDMRTRLQRNKRSTHCPLKGDTAYFDLIDQDAAILAPNIAWSYVRTLDAARDLQDRIAFDPAQVSVEESPLDVG